MGNRKDEELFLHPYSSMLKRKETQPMGRNYGNDFGDMREFSYEPIKPDSYFGSRTSESINHGRFDKPHNHNNINQ